MSESRTALLVEDDQSLGESIAFALSTCGWNVAGPFETVEAALAAIDAERFDVAILDVELKDETSQAVAVRLREEGRPFLYMTGHGSAAEVPDEFQNETRLPKPVELDELNRELLRLTTS